MKESTLYRFPNQVLKIHIDFIVRALRRAGKRYAHSLRDLSVQQKGTKDWLRGLSPPKDPQGRCERALLNLFYVWKGVCFGFPTMF